MTRSAAATRANHDPPKSTPIKPAYLQQSGVTGARRSSRPADDTGTVAQVRTEGVRDTRFGSRRVSNCAHRGELGVGVEGRALVRNLPGRRERKPVRDFRSLGCDPKRAVLPFSGHRRAREGPARGVFGHTHAKLAPVRTAVDARAGPIRLRHVAGLAPPALVAPRTLACVP